MALDFSLSDEHLAVRESVRRVCRDDVAPLVNDAEENETFPRELFRLWGRLGLIGARYPTDDGGAGLDKVAECIIREEMSAVCQGFASSWSAHSHLGIWPIWKAGTEQQRRRFFRPAVQGKKIAGFALSEPDGGSNIRALKSRAERADDGRDARVVPREDLERAAEDDVALARPVTDVEDDRTGRDDLLAQHRRQDLALARRQTLEGRQPREAVRQGVLGRHGARLSPC
jgi:hypothetical protein